MEKKYIFANWKMHFGAQDGLQFMDQLLQVVDADALDNVIFCVPFTVLWPLKSRFNDRIQLGAQNCFFEAQGAYTGEISPAMLSEIGCQYVLIGHSERRVHFGETDTGCAKKIRAVQQATMVPVLCVGEDLSTREAGQTFDLIRMQLSAIENVPPPLVIAYEPVWAIGTGKVPTCDQIRAVHQMILSATNNRFPVIYGGSVNPDNAQDILALEEVAGVLVGGVSLSKEKFLALLKIRGNK